MTERKPTFTLQEIAEFTGSTVVGDPLFVVEGYNDLESAKETDVSFLHQPKYLASRYTNAMRQTRAGALFVAPSVTLTSGKNYLINNDPSLAFQLAVEKLQGGKTPLSGFKGVHPTAIIHEHAILAAGVTVGPYAVVDAFAKIGEATFIGASSYIGPYTTIGSNCIIHPNVTIRERCVIGSQVIIQPGTTIGSCGFGYSTDSSGVHTKIPQIGTVVIEDDVEIGSNCTIDRARFTETRIGKGTKIDSLVIIGHNVRIGRHNLFCGQSGIAGSSKTGNYVVIGGQCGISGHITLEDGVQVTAKSGVSKSLKKGKYGGIPVQELSKHNKTQVLLRQLERAYAVIEEIASRLDKHDS